MREVTTTKDKYEMNSHKEIRLERLHLVNNTYSALPKVRFERMLFRATRGNCYVRFSALSGKAVDATGNHIAKVTLSAFAHILKATM